MKTSVLLDAKAAIQVAKKSTATANEILDLYGGVDTRVPWTEFKKILPVFDKYSNDYSAKSAFLVGNIKTNIMNAIDEYFESSRHISEHCSLVMPLLKAYAQLFSDYSASKAKTQNLLLQKVLGDGVQRTKLAQNELEKISTNLHSADNTLSKLFKQFDVDYDEDSDFFKTKLYHTKPPPNSKLSEKFRIDMRKAIAELKGRLSNVSKSFINLRGSVSRASLDITEIEIALKAQVRDFKELRDESEKLNDFESVDDDTELLVSIAKATGNLIVKCNDYVRSHGNR